MHSMNSPTLFVLLLLSAYSSAPAQEPAKVTASSLMDPAGEPAMVKFRKHFSDTEHYPAITAYLKSEDIDWGVGPGGHGREMDIYLPKDVAEIVAQESPSALCAFLVAYFDHPETYKLYRIPDLVVLSLSRTKPSTLIPWHKEGIPDEQIRCFGMPYYLATPLYRDLPKSEKKEDWITYFNGLRVWGIKPM